MMKLGDIKHIYFIGIGGIGMSALARYFHSLGIVVSGYDKASTPLTLALESEGMQVHYTDDLNLAPKNVEAVVYTPAIPSSHTELDFYRQNGYPVLKRSDVLQLISEHSFNICVAGTHGKTTISTMIAHILRHTGYGCNAFLGGIATNYQTNFWSHERNVCVIEADEYDRSFLKLSPDVAVISAMDPDHLDIYGTAAEMEEAYIGFTEKIRSGGLLLSRKGLSREKDLVSDHHDTYHLSDNNATVYAKNLRVEAGSYRYGLVWRNEDIGEMELPMGGIHNVENSIAAIAVALHLGIARERIRDAVAAFRGVKRRFEFIERNEEFVYVDDYAHHPEELKSLINSVKMLYPGKQSVVIFQPHLFSRTKDLADGFAEVLDEADEVILLPIYPARELPVEGVSSEMILRRMKKGNKQVMEKEALLAWLTENRPSISGKKILVTAGAGDIDQLIRPIHNILSN
jgi:UDP-N-acetylmuramate--alanine ligase